MSRYTFLLLLCGGLLVGWTACDLAVATASCPAGDEANVQYNVGASTRAAESIFDGGDDNICTCDDVRNQVGFTHSSDWGTIGACSANPNFPTFNVTMTNTSLYPLQTTGTCHDGANCDNVEAVISAIGGAQNHIWTAGLWIP